MERKLLIGRKLFSKKVLSSIAWTLGFEFILCVFVISFIYANLWNPVVWFSSILNIVLSVNTWIQFSLIVTLSAAHCVLYSESFWRVSNCKSSRFSYVYGFFSLHNLFIICTGTVLSLILVWFYTSLPEGNFNSFTTQCQLVKGLCLAEDKLFIMLNSVFIGLWITSMEFTSTVNLEYPVVHQSKFLRSKNVFLSLWKKSMIKAILPSLSFVLIYLWYRVTILEVLSDLFGVMNSNNSWYELFSVNVITFCWLMSSTFICTMFMIKFMFNLHLTERWCFPIVAANNVPEQITLSEAMSFKQSLVIHNLGYLDFLLVAQKDYDRRQHLFVLSQPGGHPYNWNGVVNECLEHICTFTEELHKAHMYLLSGKDSGNVEPVKLKEPIMSPSLEMSNYRMAMRNLSMSRVIDGSIMHQSEPLSAPGFQYWVFDFLKQSWFQIVETIGKKSIIGYIFSPNPEATVQFLLSQSQSLIWATQGIAFLTASSVKEDSYGISLKDLPAIVTALVKLKNAVDKLPKFGQNRRIYKNSLHNKLETALRAAVKRSLYKICITYGELLNEINLSKDTLQELRNYITQ